ncbi:MAG TPA: HWE histidine kinase domain-containing protein [Sphingobium sp.]|nr:HWE histidine kinase domain-containing protein [Sphingobium sp.]
MTWPDGSSEMAERIRIHDWAATALGPADLWPAALRHSVDLLLSHPLPMALLWGSDNILIYNDGYATALQGKHPSALGRPLYEVWPEVQHLNESALDRVRRDEAVLLKEVLVPATWAGRMQDNWFDVAQGPIHDQDGRVAGILVTVLDKTVEVRAQRRLRDTEELQAFLLRLSDALRPLADPVKVQRTAMALLCDHFHAIRAIYFEIGADGDAIIGAEGADISGIPIPTTLRLSGFGEWVSKALADRQPVQMHDVDLDPRLDDARRAAYRSYGVRASAGIPLFKGGHVAVMMAIHLAEPHDWTAKDMQLLEEVAERTWEAVERARAESALRRSEQRLQLALDAASMGTFVWHLETDHVDYDARAHALFGEPPDATTRLLAFLTEIMHPEDRQRCRAAWLLMRSAGKDGHFHEEFRICPSHEPQRWLAVAAQAASRDGTHVSHVVGTVRDVTPAREVQERIQGSEERLRVVVAELQHRVRNILTVVRSVFSRTFLNGNEPDEMADHFRGRLDALARTQVIVTQTAAGTADLENLIRDELMSVGVRDGPTVRIAGPDVMLSSRIAESLGLAVHELTTNALKYGALKVEGATLDIGWQTARDSDGALRLELVWQEVGVPAVPLDPIKEGFGRELIEGALPYRLGAETRIEFRGGGLRCTLSVPLDRSSPAVEALRVRSAEEG